MRLLCFVILKDEWVVVRAFFSFVIVVFCLFFLERSVADNERMLDVL